MTKLFFKNEKTGKRFEIINLDKAANQITLRGETTTFTEKYDKEWFKSLGYTLEKE